MQPSEIQDACERGQQLLIQTEYWQAELLLAEAEAAAWNARDFDALSRLYLPLQECRRQRRQNCLEGTIRPDMLARSADDRLDTNDIATRYPRGTLLVAGWQSFAPAMELRRLQFERRQFAETFLAAAYSTDRGIWVAIAPFAIDPTPSTWSDDELQAKHCLTMPESHLHPCAEATPLDLSSWANAMWERLHAPFLAEADAEIDPIRKIELYRKTIAVDYGCELAHQNLATVARKLA